MDYSFKQTAKEALEQLDRNQAEEILDAVAEVANQGFDHEKVKMIKDRKGNWLYRIKVNGDVTNHRVFIDYVERELRVLDIMHRSVAYEDKYGNG